MRTFTRPLAVTLIAAGIPALAFAEQTPTGDRPAFERPSPETLTRIEDGRIAFAKAALKLTPEQEKLWAPVEAKIRADFSERQTARETWRAKHEERKAKGEAGKPGKPALPERLEMRGERMIRMGDWMHKRAETQKQFAELLKPLYASFSEEQKAVSGSALGRFFDKGGHGSRGPRWANNHGRGSRGPGPDVK